MSDVVRKFKFFKVFYKKFTLPMIIVMIDGVVFPRLLGKYELRKKRFQTFISTVSTLRTFNTLKT